LKHRAARDSRAVFFFGKASTKMEIIVRFRSESSGIEIQDSPLKSLRMAEIISLVLDVEARNF
jgi:hypothetical protein